jgi:CRP-like cAMP-binding protein
VILDGQSRLKEDKASGDGDAGTTVSASGAKTLMGAGDFFGESSLLLHRPRPGRDPAAWVATVDTSVLALPTSLLRLMFISESALLDSWTEAGLASLLGK